MRRALGLLILAVALLAGPVAAAAAEWGLIRPGISTMDAIRAQYGTPSRVDRQKVDNYDTESWIYEGERTPVGILRLTVEFGLVQAEQYRREIVRALRLEPHGATFNRGVVTNGWGYPDRLGHEAGEDIFLYRKEGLLVYFDKEGWNARLMIFTLPQPRDPTEDSR